MCGGAHESFHYLRSDLAGGSHGSGSLRTLGGKQGEQEKPAAPTHDMEHTNHGAGHGGFMQGGMHHAVATGVKLDANVDAARAYRHAPRLAR